MGIAYCGIFKHVDCETVKLLHFHNSSDNSIYSVILSVSLSNNYFSIINRMSSDTCPSERMCPSTSEQMCFPILVYHHNGLYQLRTADREHPPCISWLSYPPSTVWRLFSWQWLCGTAHRFYQIGPPLFSELKSGICFYTSFKETCTWGSFFSALRTVSLRSFFYGRLCCLLWCLLHGNLQCTDCFPLLDYHLTTWRRCVSHNNIISVRPANRKLEKMFTRECFSSVWYWLFWDICQFFNSSCSLPLEIRNQLWTVVLVHAFGAVTLQMLKRVFFGKWRKWKCVLILLCCVWRLWPEGPCVLLLTLWCWHSSALRTSAASWLPCVLLDYFSAFSELLKVVAHTLQILRDYFKCMFNQLALW